MKHGEFKTKRITGRSIIFQLPTSTFFSFAIWVKMFGLKIIFEIIKIINEL